MIKALMLAYKRNLVYKATCKELSSLSNAELYDLGLERYNIKFAAYEATYGKGTF